MIRARLGLHFGPFVFTHEPRRRRRRAAQPDWFTWSAAAVAIAAVMAAYLALK